MSLDQLSACLSPLEGVGKNFYWNLVFSGLPACIEKKTASKHPYPVLKHRIASYVPQSSLHMHIDAAEIGGVLSVNDYMDLPDLKTNVVNRIQELLFKLWNTSSGLMYSNLSQNDDLNKPGFLRGRKIDLSTLTDDYDIEVPQVHRLLLALAGYEDLLHDKQLFETWALDLATAALLLRTTFWVKRYEVFSSGYRPEVIYLDALESVFFREWDDERCFNFLMWAKIQGRFRWGDFTFKLFYDAKSYYHSLLRMLGISYLDVISGFKYCDEVYPLVYSGGVIRIDYL